MAKPIDCAMCKNGAFPCVCGKMDGSACSHKLKLTRCDKTNVTFTKADFPMTLTKDKTGKIKRKA